MPRTLLKPAGIPVFPPHADPAGDCVLARVLAREPWRGAAEWPRGFQGGLAHRLDTSTSGALLVADDPAELGRIRERFAGGVLEKTYLFLAARDVSWDHNRCQLPLAHDRRHRGRMVVKRGARTPHRGRWLPAETRFRRVSGRLWEARMRTGVMHQVRVHAGFLGLAILGDRRYGGGPTPDGAPEGLEFFLHHVGLEGGGIRTDAVERPSWAG